MSESLERHAEYTHITGHLGGERGSTRMWGSRGGLFVRCMGEGEGRPKGVGERGEKGWRCWQG